jgi:hypothetical protein
VHLLLSTLTISRSRVIFLASSGITNAWIMSSKDMTHLSYALLLQRFNRSISLTFVCRMITPLIANSIYLWFQIVTTQRSKRSLSYPFLWSTQLTHCSDEPLDPCWLSMWKREKSSFWRTIGERMYVWHIYCVIIPCVIIQKDTCFCIHLLFLRHLTTYFLRNLWHLIAKKFPFWWHVWCTWVHLLVEDTLCQNDILNKLASPKWTFHESWQL